MCLLGLLWCDDGPQPVETIRDTRGSFCSKGTSRTIRERARDWKEEEKRVHPTTTPGWRGHLALSLLLSSLYFYLFFALLRHPHSGDRVWGCVCVGGLDPEASLRSLSVCGAQRVGSVLLPLTSYFYSTRKSQRGCDLRSM